MHQPPLRILIDAARRMDVEGTGISSYSRTLAAGLAALGHHVSWLVGAHAPRCADPLVDAASVADAPPAARGPRLYAQTAKHMLAGIINASAAPRRLDAQSAIVAAPGMPAEQIWLAPDLFVHAHYRHMLLGRFSDVKIHDKADVLHLTAPSPLRADGARMVTTIHDLVPIRLPYTTPDNKREFVRRVRMVAQLSDLIITVSEASKRDITDLLDIDPARIAVTYQPSDLDPLSTQEREHLPRSLARFGLAPQRYALFVGAIEPKKNLRRLIHAFLETESETPLVIVGRRAWMWEREIGDLNDVLGAAARKRLRFLGYASREDLRTLYAGAMMFLFPSLYEGFGLPVLEAMRAGCPVLTSRTSSLPEVCGDAAVYVDPTDRADIRKGIESLLEDRARRDALSTAGRQQAERFSFDRYVAALGEAYARLSR